MKKIFNLLLTIILASSSYLLSMETSDDDRLENEGCSAPVPKKTKIEEVNEQIYNLLSQAVLADETTQETICIILNLFGTAPEIANNIVKLADEQSRETAAKFLKEHFKDIFLQRPLMDKKSLRATLTILKPFDPELSATIERAYKSRLQLAKKIDQQTIPNLKSLTALINALIIIDKQFFGSTDPRDFFAETLREENRASIENFKALQKAFPYFIAYSIVSEKTEKKRSLRIEFWNNVAIGLAKKGDYTGAIMSAAALNLLQVSRLLKKPGKSNELTDMTGDYRGYQNSINKNEQEINLPPFGYLQKKLDRLSNARIDNPENENIESYVKLWEMLSDIYAACNNLGHIVNNDCKKCEGKVCANCALSAPKLLIDAIRDLGNIIPKVPNKDSKHLKDLSSPEDLKRLKDLKRRKDLSPNESKGLEDLSSEDLKRLQDLKRLEHYLEEESYKIVPPKNSFARDKNASIPEETKKIFDKLLCFLEKVPQDPKEDYINDWNIKKMRRFMNKSDLPTSKNGASTSTSLRIKRGSVIGLSSSYKF